MGCLWDIIALIVLVSLNSFIGYFLFKMEDDPMYGVALLIMIIAFMVWYCIHEHKKKSRDK